MSLVRNLTLAAVGAFGLGGCATLPYGGVGVGVGSGYYDPYQSGYGYGGSPYGYGGSPYGYGGSPYGGYGAYGSPYYGGYSPYGGYGGYGSPYGWYNGYYYPGSGGYVYDRERRTYPLTNALRRRFEEQRVLERRSLATRQQQVQTQQQVTSTRTDRRAYRNDRRQDRAAVQGGTVVRGQNQSARQERREVRQEQRGERRVLSRAIRQERQERKPD